MFEKILQYQLHCWNIVGRHLVFVHNEREVNIERKYTHIHLVRLGDTIQQTEVTSIKTTEVTFYRENEDGARRNSSRYVDFLGFYQNYLILANNNMIRYGRCPEDLFRRDSFTLEYSKICQIKQQVRILDIVAIQNSQPCLIVESTDTQLNFLAMDFEPLRDIMVVSEMSELVPGNSRHDPHTKVKSKIFLDKDGNQCHCAISLRKSGSVCFYWNFRLVDEEVITDPLTQGYFTDIEADFYNLYFQKSSFITQTEKSKSKFSALRQKIDGTTSRRSKIMKKASKVADKGRFDPSSDKIDELQKYKEAF